MRIPALLPLFFDFFFDFFAGCFATVSRSTSVGFNDLRFSASRLLPTDFQIAFFLPRVTLEAFSLEDNSIRSMSTRCRSASSDTGFLLAGKTTF